MLTKSERAAMRKSCEAFPYPDGVEDDLLRLLDHATEADEVIAGLVGQLRGVEGMATTAYHFATSGDLARAGDSFCEIETTIEAALADPRLAAIAAGVP